MSRRRHVWAEWSRRAALMGAGALVGLLVAEGVLAVAYPANDRFLVLQPNLRRVFRPDPAAVPGISGASRFEVDSRGLRGDERLETSGPAVLVLGGSTAECLLLDQAEAWPQLVQELLRKASGRRAWVGNAGKSGRNTRSHRLQIEHLPAQIENLRGVVMLAGANDLLLRLRQGEAYDPRFLERPEGVRMQLAIAFHRLPEAFWAEVYEPGRPAYKKTALWRLGRDARKALAARRPGGEGALVVQDAAGRHLIESRRKRAAARPLRGELPDLDAALEEYRRNLRRIADSAEAQGFRLLLLTQPAMWRADLPPELDRLLWMGHGEGGVYYSNEALAGGLERYNRVMLEVCRERGVDCLDLASLLARDGSVFYDDVHFTEAGSREVAAAVASRLLAWLDQGAEP